MENIREVIQLRENSNLTWIWSFNFKRKEYFNTPLPGDLIESLIDTFVHVTIIFISMCPECESHVIIIMQITSTFGHVF